MRWGNKGRGSGRWIGDPEARRRRDSPEPNIQEICPAVSSINELSSTQIASIFCPPGSSILFTLSTPNALYSSLNSDNFFAGAGCKEITSAAKRVTKYLSAPTSISISDITAPHAGMTIIKITIILFQAKLVEIFIY
jgi:hypothetical protein